MLWVISVYFNIRNILPQSGTFLLGYPVYVLSVLDSSQISKERHYLGKSQVSTVWPSVKSSCEDEDEHGAIERDGKPNYSDVNPS